MAVPAPLRLHAGSAPAPLSPGRSTAPGLQAHSGSAVGETVHLLFPLWNGLYLFPSSVIGCPTDVFSAVSSQQRDTCSGSPGWIPVLSLAQLAVHVHQGAGQALGGFAHVLPSAPPLAPESPQSLSAAIHSH